MRPRRSAMRRPTPSPVNEHQHMRPRSATLAGRLSTGVAFALVPVGMLVSGCAASGGPDLSGSMSGDVGPQPPVRLPGVQPCGALVDSMMSESNGDGLKHRELACLSNGPSVDAAGLVGRPTLINLWASWCGPCREEMPLLQAEFERRGGDVTFVGVDTKDGSEQAAAFLASIEVTYPQLSDPDAGLLGDLRSPGLPVTVILDAEGAVSQVKIGPFEDQSELSQAVDEATN